MEERKFDLKNIKAIVGLGNIGKDYLRTRHNAGFQFLDSLSKDYDFNEEKKLKSLINKLESNPTTYNLQSITLIKPTTLMNHSGESVQLLMNFYKLNSDEILIVFDDLDLRLGEYKIQFSKYPKVHNGLSSIFTSTNSDNYWFLRIGIDNRSQDQRKFISGSDYVLSRFSEEELKILKETFAKISNSLFDPK